MAHKDIYNKQVG